MNVADGDGQLAAIANGDRGAFALWMVGAEIPLRRRLRRFATVVDTEAVLQEALLRVWQIAPRCRPDGQPHALLRLAARITTNLAISEARRHRLVPATFGDDLPEIAIDPPSVPDESLRVALSDCRGKLPPQPAQALSARLDSAGLRSDADLACELGMRTNTFLQNITRARALLMKCLERLGIDITLELS